ncbi:trypsin-like peptidase domain-containing protein [Photobacterium swingsii]|uniref:trypsin-like peptidase domain-containing protein n=1 Tax=Photobacterium swingsii TaxID=680026 RepID=UPI004067EB1B
MGLDDSQKEMLALVDVMVKKWSDILVPIYTEKENHNGVAQLLGTGFLLSFENHIYLVTALHVIKDHANELLVVKVGEKAVALSKMPFHISNKDDLAISRISSGWMQEHGIERVKAIPLESTKSTDISLGRYFLIGFPGKKNVLNPRVGKLKAHIQGVSFIKKITAPEADSHIENPLAFEFDKKEAINSELEKINVPKFNGNSGGPILELIESNGSISCRFSGVFLGWHSVEKEVIATQPNAVMELIGH